jgi:pyruvate,water dikinase
MYIFNPYKSETIDKELTGNKAANLYQLYKAGYNVPEWFVITTNAFEQYCMQKSTVDKIDNLKQTTDNIVIQEEIEIEIVKSLDDLSLQDDFLAVRSSATIEDSPDFSFAGQFDSFLYVKADNLIETIKKVWLSAFSERAINYLKLNNLNPEDLKLAVIIQKMIDADVSGIAFGLDPLSGDKNTVVISATYGTGQGLVSGEFTGDTYKVIDNKINSQITKKTVMYKLDTTNGYGVTCKQVNTILQTMPSLKDQQVLNIVEKVQKINNLFNAPQDIEWAFYNEKLYLLQARPITIIYKKPDKNQFKYIWDNSNIIESYADVTLPLTFSFIRRVYTEVYIQFSIIMGVEQNTIEENLNIFEMIGLIQGRVYYNLNNWYKILSLLPGYSINADFMEQMMGVKEKIDCLPVIKKTLYNDYFRVAKLSFNLIYNFYNLPGMIKAFYDNLNNTLKPIKSQDLKEKDVFTLLEYYNFLVKKLLKSWNAPIINDFYAMIFYGFLKKFVKEWGISLDDTLQNDLLVGEGDIISTEPVRSILKLSNIIIDQDEIKQFFLNNKPDTILEGLNNYPEVKILIENHLERFGDRCVNELKLETKTYKHKPEKFISLLQKYINQGPFDLENIKNKEQNLRLKAEKVVNQSLNNKPLKKIIFNFILKNAREKIKNRENLRFERTRVFACIRDIFLETGKKLSLENIINETDDIFYLTTDEVFSYAHGTAISANLKDIISLRKIEYSHYEKINIPGRFETHGIAYNNTFKHEKPSPMKDYSYLQGIGCSPGKVKASVKIVKNPEIVNDLSGYILVAEKTDPGWAPLFSMAKGLLVERGSLLSHSAIVAREMGIPAIVGIDNLLESLKDNMIVEMDGQKGIVLLKTENNEHID